MVQKLIALKSKKGFTLMEMLIVIAIIAILAAVAIPTFSSQLTAAKTRTDEANLRAAESLAVSDYMLENRSGAVTYYFVESAGGSIEIGGINTGASIEPANGHNSSELISGQATPANTIRVVITNSAVTTSEWDASSGITFGAPAPTPTPAGGAPSGAD